MIDAKYKFFKKSWLSIKAGQIEPPFSQPRIFRLFYRTSHMYMCSAISLTKNKALILYNYLHRLLQIKYL